MICYHLKFKYIIYFIGGTELDVYLFYFATHAFVSSMDISSFSDRPRFLCPRVTRSLDGHPHWLRPHDDREGDGFRVGSAGQNEVEARSVDMN